MLSMKMENEASLQAPPIAKCQHAWVALGDAMHMLHIHTFAVTGALK